MYSDLFLQAKANRIGYYLKSGYIISDMSAGFYELNTDNYRIFWTNEDIVAFLKDQYEKCGLNW